MAGPVVHFVVVKGFSAVVNGTLTNYREGGHYHARAGSLWDDLRSQVPAWERAGLVAVGLHASAEMITGSARGPLVLGSGRATVGRRAIMAGDVVVFEALEDFEETVNKRAVGYAKGQRYTAREGDAHDDLRAQLAKWEKAGKVRVVSSGPAPKQAAAVKGGGEATTEKRG